MPANLYVAPRKVWQPLKEALKKMAHDRRRKQQWAANARRNTSTVVARVERYFSDDAVAAATRRRVTVWLHGGALIFGAGSLALYDSAAEDRGLWR